MSGILALFHFFAYFLVLGSMLKSKSDWLKFFDVFVASSLSVSLSALGQKFGLITGGGRLAGIFGNSAYLAAYLLFALAITALLFINRQGKNQRIYYRLVFLFHLYILYGTQTRGALLGLIFALFLFALFLIVFSKKEGASRQFVKIRRIAVSCLIIFVILAGIVYLSRNNDWIKKSGALSRITNISLQDETTQTRLLAWKLSWKAFKEKPVFGWGWENYNIAFGKYYDPLMFPTENWFDRAHNIVFDLLVGGGAVAFIGFFGMLGMVFFSLWRALKKKQIGFMEFGILTSLLVAYLIQDMFIFDMLHSYLPLSIILAFIYWISIAREDGAKEQKKAGRPKEAGIFQIGTLFLILIIFVYAFNIHPAIASYWAIEGVKSQKNSFKMMEAFGKSLEYGSFVRFETRSVLMDKTKEKIEGISNETKKEELENLIKFSLAEGDKQLAELPKDARSYLRVGHLNMISGSFDSEWFKIAEDILTKGHELSPKKQLLLFALGEVKMKLGKNEEGIGYLKEALALNDKAVDSWKNLMFGYFYIGDFTGGKNTMSEIKNRFPEAQFAAEDFTKIANIAALKNRFAEAAEYFQEAIKIKPTAQLYATLAANYQQAGDKIKARDAALKAAELDPSFAPEAEQFIKQLGL
jgi:O-antigen ligase/tetratricopeptide (TPR) repeat protein